MNDMSALEKFMRTILNGALFALAIGLVIFKAGYVSYAYIINDSVTQGLIYGR